MIWIQKSVRPIVLDKPLHSRKKRINNQGLDWSLKCFGIERVKVVVDSDKTEARRKCLSLKVI